MDATETARRLTCETIRAVDPDKAALETEYGKVWDTDELTTELSVKGFAAPFVVVCRKADGVEGSMMFRSRPRFYFGFSPA